jgi:hypothetical protein
VSNSPGVRVTKQKEQTTSICYSIDITGSQKERVRFMFNPKKLNKGKNLEKRET